MDTLNVEQQEAVEKIQKWFEDPHKKQVFVLSGYAGTGKTFLINYLMKNVLKLSKTKVAFATFTGKAAEVLIRKGQTSAMTIHRLIYNVVETKYKTKVNNKEIISKKISFFKKETLPDYKLIVLDEISMIDEKIMEDILSYGIPVLGCGDIGQLPAIMKSNDLLQHPDFNLTQIVRQNDKNSIIQLATRARNGLMIYPGNYGDVMILERDRLQDSTFKNILLSADEIICGKNSTRHILNEEVRSYSNRTSIYPEDGEKVICTVNNWEIYLDDNYNYNLVNGIIGYASNFKIEDIKLKIGKFNFKPDFLDKTATDIICDAGIYEKNEYTYDMHQRVYIMSDGTYKLKAGFVDKRNYDDYSEYCKKVKEAVIEKNEALATEQINDFEYAYCISCHKSQGDEWDKVVVFDESQTFGKDSNKWLYTAITRAKKKLIIIK
jgi:exodeoxyribonuclease-5